MFPFRIESIKYQRQPVEVKRGRDDPQGLPRDEAKR
jgi:hypothetical protein